MKNSITIYSPDSHLTYDLTTIDEKGIGGGATARIRMAHALAARGNSVKLFINCHEEKIISGVEYIHYSQLVKNDSDIFIASTSGGQQDLSSLDQMTLNNHIKILLVHGVKKPRGVDSFPMDFVYAPSNFIRREVISKWNISSRKIFITHRGVEENNYIPGDTGIDSRNPFAIIYASHPSKGLNSAISIFHLLKEVDPRFSLHVFGGYEVWGEDRQVDIDDHVIFHGLIGQKLLAKEMQKSGFSLCLQNREEPFGMTLLESMRAGCIVIASAVGAYPEIIRHGYNGFLIPGDQEDKKTHREAADLILRLIRNNDYSNYVRRNAIGSPQTWDNIAQTWEGHWAWVLANSESQYFSLIPGLGICPECHNKWLAMSDGFHCTGCGNYLDCP